MRPSPLAGGSNGLQKTRVEVSNRNTGHCTIPNGAADGTRDGRSVLVESEILDRIVVGKAASLPTGGMVALDDEERDSGRITRAGIEQGAQNLALRGAQLDFGDGARQIGRSGRGIGTGGLGGCGRGGDLFHDPADNLGAQLGCVAVENLADYPLHDWLNRTWLNPTALLHASSGHAYSEVKLWGKKGAAL